MLSRCCDVEGGVDADAGVEQFLHVLPALRVAKPGAFVWASSSTRMISGWRRGPRRDPVRGWLCPGSPPRARGGSRGHRAGRSSLDGSCVSTYPATRSTPAAVCLCADFKHGVRLADAGHVAEEDLELTPPRAAAPLLCSCLRSLSGSGRSSSSMSPRWLPSALLRSRVERTIQFEDVHSRFADKTELTAA